MAIYNYGLPYPQYQYPVQQTVSNTPITATQNNSAGIIWVQGEAGAKAYPVAPGNSVLLMDSEKECFYIKSTDASGVPMPLRAFSYTEIVQTQPSYKQEPDIQYVTKAEFDELKRMFEDLSRRKENRNEQTLSRNSKQQHGE
jgi:hypothetical protein